MGRLLNILEVYILFLWEALWVQQQVANMDWHAVLVTFRTSAMGDLRKIPGFCPTKMLKSNFDQRLVQAVVARHSELTVKDVRFCTRYGAAVIAVHWEGKQTLQDHPGKIQLLAGDVLLWKQVHHSWNGDARNGRHRQSSRLCLFALIAELQHSATTLLLSLQDEWLLYVAWILLVIALILVAFVRTRTRTMGGKEDKE